MAQHFTDPWAGPNDPVASAIDDLYIYQKAIGLQKNMMKRVKLI